MGVLDPLVFVSPHDYQLSLDMGINAPLAVRYPGGNMPEQWRIVVDQLWRRQEKKSSWIKDWKELKKMKQWEDTTIQRMTNVDSLLLHASSPSNMQQYVCLVKHGTMQDPSFPLTFLTSSNRDHTTVIMLTDDECKPQEDTREVEEERCQLVKRFISRRIDNDHVQYHHHDGSGSLNQVIQKVAKDYPHIRCNVALVHSSLVKTVLEQYLLQKGGIVVPTFEGSTCT